jgi:DNA adenine methylase
MGFTRSPLRYPGGKSRLAPFILSLIKSNNLVGSYYIEAFAGGAGIAWYLLFNGHVSKVILNDLDPAIYAFWHVVFFKTEELCNKIINTPINIKIWKEQKNILENPKSYTQLELGFATFYLNRTNRSGIIRGGVIGGKNQTSKWKINARYNKRDLLQRIRRIAKYRESVKLYKLDALIFIKSKLPKIKEKYLVFIDPPYIHRGHDLYMNNYHTKEHSKLATIIKNKKNINWVVSYDNVPEIKNYYGSYRRRLFHLNYSINHRYLGSEVMVFSPTLTIPRKIF